MISSDLNELLFILSDNIESKVSIYIAIRIAHNIIMYHFTWADQRLLQGNIRYIALEPGQYLDIAREGGFWPAFDQSTDLPFDLQVTVTKTLFVI